MWRLFGCMNSLRLIIWTEFCGEYVITRGRFWAVAWPLIPQCFRQILPELFLGRGTAFAKIPLPHLVSEHEGKMHRGLSLMAFVAKHRSNVPPRTWERSGAGDQNGSFHNRSLALV